jgi:putative copper export protein/mono/diheme cytochrome c family protein
VDDPLIWARAVHFIAMIMATGAVFFAVLIAEPAFQKAGHDGSLAAGVRRNMARITWIGLAVALISGIAWLVLVAEEMSDRTFAQMLSENVIWVVLADTGYGHGWLVRLGLGGLLAGICLWSPAPWQTDARRMIAVVLAAVLVGMLAWASHAVGTEGVEGAVHFTADVLHLIAAAAWVGTLLPLALLLRAAWKAHEPVSLEVAQIAVLRFSAVGVVAVATIFATGLVNTWFLAGSIPALFGTEYGRLLLVKIALFLAMVALAGVNRSWLRPRLFVQGKSSDALWQIGRNAALEAGLGWIILGVVAALGTLPPGLHEQPVWPFSVRLDTGIFNEPDLYIAILFGIGWIAFGIAMRRFRWPAIAVGIVILGLEAWRLPFPQAYPTTFLGSPTGFSAQSIATGESLFAANCAACHGAEGHGDGPAAASLKTMPADLTADHIYEHPDGDLFWWITHGIDTGMPAFGDQLDEQSRWSLIDFIHANADAARLRMFGNGTTAAFPTPDFSVDCPAGSTVPVGDLRPQILHIVLAGPGLEDWLHAIAERDRGAKLRTIVVAPDPAAAEGMSLCASQEPETFAVFSHYRGTEPVEGTELLVDSAGELRAMWRDEDLANSRAAEALALRVRGLQTAARVRRPAGMPGHMHMH